MMSRLENVYNYGRLIDYIYKKIQKKIFFSFRFALTEHGQSIVNFRNSATYRLVSL